MKEYYNLIHLLLLKSNCFAIDGYDLLTAFAEDGTIYETSGELWGRDSGGTLYKNTGEIWGRVTEGGTIYRTDGQIWGRVSEGGAIYRTDGQILGRVSK